MVQRKDAVQKSVAKFAESYGNKSANLIELSQLCQQIMSLETELKVQVPSICPLPHDLVYSHLTKHAPQWLKLWNDFIKTQKKDDKEISDKSKKIITQLQELILKTFQKYPFDFTVVNDYLDKLNIKSDLLMVRSTGKEDSKELANPGGNESVAAIKAESKSISQAMGVVVASYFSEKSLKQRLLGKDDITQPPFIPVLLQKMEGEILGGAKTSDQVVRSGVMYTGQRGTRIQVAPGHGELIVNSKAPFDSFYISREGVVHSEIHQKTKRLIPVEHKTQTGVKRTLEMTDNSKELRDTPSMPEHILRRLAKIGEFIEEHYGEPMDVEFVYDPAKNLLNIVQARPIPIGDLRLFPPSSIRPDKLGELKKIANIQKGSVITPAGSAAKVITSKDEIIVCQTIEEALTIYLSQRASQVKAVIVKNDAPETSHEAAQFNSKAIPVLRVDDINSIQESLKQNNIALIIDPQRKQIVDVNKMYDRNIPEKAKTIATNLLQVGIFKSTMSAQETLQDVIPRRSFKYSTFYRKPKRVNIGKMLDAIRSKKSLIANEAFNNLMRTLYEVIKDGPKKTAHFKDMPKLLEEIENAVPGKDNKKAVAALQMILNRFVGLAKSLEQEEKVITDNKDTKATQVMKDSKKIHKSLFKQAMITGAEIYHILTESGEEKIEMIEGVSFYDLEEKKSDETIKSERLELLNLVIKLEALISAPARSGLFSSSLYQWAVEQQLRKKAMFIPGFNSLSSDKQDYFIALLQMRNLALNKPLNEAWTQFALRICQDDTKIQKIADLILFMQKFNVSSDWLNERFILSKDISASQSSIINPSSFLSSIQDHESKEVHQVIETSFNNIIKEAEITKKELEALKLDDSAAILTSWEQKLTQFAEQEKFPKLWKEFSADVIPIIDKLAIKPSMQPLTQKSILNMVLQLTEIMDHSIKAMKGSPTYNDKKIQVKNFYSMLEPYLRLMKKWVEQVPDERFTEYSNRLQDRRSANYKGNILSSIESTFKNQHSNTAESQLLPSSRFAVAPACFDSGTSFARHFNDLKSSITLEDLFTLMHQNIISATHQIRNQTRISVLAMPEPLQNLNNAITSIQCQGNQPKLLNTDHQFPILRLEYNLSLRNHSAKIIITYDQVQKTCQIQGKFFGHNNASRMDFIADMAKIFPLSQKIKTIQSATHNPDKRVVDFKWELNSEQLASHALKIKEELKIFANTTFSRPNQEILTTFINRNFDSRTDLTSQQLKDLFSLSLRTFNFDSISISISNNIIQSFLKMPKLEQIDFILIILQSTPQRHLNSLVTDLLRKSYSNDDMDRLKEIESIVAINTKLNLSSSYAEKIDHKTIEDSLQKMANSQSMQLLGHTALKTLLKFPMDSKDIRYILETLRDNPSFDSIYTSGAPYTRTNINAYIKPLIAKQVDQKEITEYVISTLNSGKLKGLRLVPDDFKIDRELSSEEFKKYVDVILKYTENYEICYAALITLFKFKLKEDQIQFLLTKKVANDSLLAWSVYMDNLEMTKFLIGRGNSPNTKDRDGSTLLGLAIGRRNLPMVEFLLNSGATPKLEPTELTFAIKKQNVEIVKLILSNGNYDLNEIKEAITYAKTLTSVNARNIEKLLTEAESNLSVARGMEMKKS